MSSTGYALTGFVSWALFLLVIMETIRTYFVVTGKVAANGFTPDNSDYRPSCSASPALMPTASKVCRFSAACWRLRS